MEGFKYPDILPAYKIIKYKITHKGITIQKILSNITVNSFIILDIGALVSAINSVARMEYIVQMTIQHFKASPIMLNI